MRVEQGFLELRQRAVELASGPLRTFAIATDRDGTAPRESLRAVCDAGLAAAAIPVGERPPLSLEEICSLAEILGEGCASTALCMVMHWTSCLYLGNWVPELAEEDVAEFHAMQQRVFDRVRSGRGLIANCYGEPGSGAAIHRPFTTAEWTGRVWRVNGSKFGTMADVADMIQFHACVPPIAEGSRQIVQFLVPATTAGISFEPMGETVSVRGAAPLKVTFSNCEIGDQHRFGPVGLFDRAGRAYPYAGLLLAAPYVGVAQAALVAIVGHLKSRRPQGSHAPLADLPALRLAVAQMFVDLESARALLYRAASTEVPDPGPDRRRLVDAAKIAVARMAVQVTRQAMEIGGVRMLMRHAYLERHLRDSLAAAAHPPSIPEALEAIGETLLSPPAQDTSASA